jgi:hypothetical protein
VLLSAAGCCQGDSRPASAAESIKSNRCLNCRSVGSLVHRCGDDQGIGLFDCFSDNRLPREVIARKCRTKARAGVERIGMKPRPATVTGLDEYRGVEDLRPDAVKLPKAGD